MGRPSLTGEGPWGLGLPAPLGSCQLLAHLPVCPVVQEEASWANWGATAPLGLHGLTRA